MCGRYASFRQAQDLADAFARNGYFQDVLFADGTEQWDPAWNIAPTHDVRIVVDRPLVPGAAETLVTASGSVSQELQDLAGQRQSGAAPAEFLADDLVRQVRRARWGLVPSWAKDPSIGSRMTNARSETITEKPSFRKAFATRRCIIPADGYYEWTTLEGPPKQKIPHYIVPADGSMFAFAGIYEFWKPQDDPDGQWLVTASIITTAAHGELAEIHERRPVFLTPDVFTEWLDPATTVDQARLILDIPVLDVNVHTVSTDVNKVANRGPHLILPV